MILIFSLLSSDASIIIPLFFFVGIIVGMIEKEDMKIGMLNAFIASFIGAIISFAISVIVIYYAESPLYAIGVIQSAKFLLIFYVAMAIVGSAIGYYVADEIDN